MWVRKGSVEAVEEALEFGERKRFFGLNRDFPKGFRTTYIISRIQRLPICTFYIELRKKMHWLFKGFAYNDS